MLIPRAEKKEKPFPWVFPGGAHDEGKPRGWIGSLPFGAGYARVVPLVFTFSSPPKGKPLKQQS